MPNDLYQPTASQILNFRPRDLRTWLTKRMAADPSLSTKIVEIVGFTPRWSALSTIQFAQVALAWASLRTSSVSNREFSTRLTQDLTSIVNVSTIERS